MKFKDLKIGDKFCYYGGVCYFIKVSETGYKTVNDKGYIFNAMPAFNVDKVENELVR